MKSSAAKRGGALVFAALLWSTLPAFCQDDDAAGKLSRSIQEQSSSTRSPAVQKAHPQAGAAIGSTGASLTTSEAVFTVAAGLNACGYNAGLATAAPVRIRVRQEMDAAVAAGGDAAAARDALCAFIHAHDLGDPVRTVSQFISLSLMLEPGPELKLVPITDQLPPDASNVQAMLPLLRKFADAVHLHALWVESRGEYEELIAPLREPLTKLLLSSGVYLGQTESGNQDRRFVVIAEPMFGGGVVSARIYGLDYLMVLAPPTTPEQRTRFDDDVEHFYLEFAVDPVLLGYPKAMVRLEPILKAVNEAPLEGIYREDVTALIRECLVRAIEARTMSTGIVLPKSRSGERLATGEGQASFAAVQQDEAIRLAVVQRAEEQGFILTRYFYEKLGAFQTHSETLRDAMGEMVYGIDPDLTVRRYKNYRFVAAAQPGPSGSVAPKTPGVRPSLQAREPGLSADSATPTDLVAQAEQELADGKMSAAETTAQSAIEKRQGDTGRATYVLAMAQVRHGDAESAAGNFAKALTLTKDPHTLAWSHIYLGRIADLEGDRQKALGEYKSALGVKSGLPDANAAAESGMRQPFAAPSHPPQENQ